MSKLELKLGSLGIILIQKSADRSTRIYQKNNWPDLCWCQVIMSAKDVVDHDLAWAGELSALIISAGPKIVNMSNIAGWSFGKCRKHKMVAEVSWVIRARLRQEYRMSICLSSRLCWRRTAPGRKKILETKSSSSDILACTACAPLRLSCVQFLSSSSQEQYWARRTIEQEQKLIREGVKKKSSIVRSK